MVGDVPNRRGETQSAPTAKRLRAELKMMREIIVVLVQAITDLFACLPKDLYAAEKVTRIEATLANVHRVRAERRRRWASEDDEWRT
jgi:hypothetical protein